MIRYLIQRLILFVSALFVSSFVVFSALYLMPGDPIRILTGGRSLPPEALQALRERYHLDEPFLQRYGSWLSGVLRGDLGTSVIFNQDVSEMLATKVVLTLQLVLYAGVILVVLGVGLGLIAGLRRGAVDSVIVGATAFLAAIPPYMAAIVLLSVFAVGLGWFPAIGAGADGERLLHLTLPAIALALSSLAIVARVTRVAVRGESDREHVQTAVSRGFLKAQIVRRHILRNALMPITTIVGVAVASLLAVSAVVEQAFSLDGIGSALVQAALARDMAVVQAIALLFVFAFIATNTLVDILYVFLDPRIKAGKEPA
ncbi:ABC transporter permease [Arthrobacter sp. CDRTa11]|uniref:ABC transporter permease n=1 Tax=Arthrobacter sp. CDRTa11 TaxID=2651199 RepID=UPI002265E61B|nr:ABC transporter permease [Arthrobacter sp. CDRTa11]UZX02860.1 ABC transporter permease [Arthrobacter sp. CDRTa11]